MADSTPAVAVASTEYLPTQHSGSGFFANARNLIINGGIFNYFNIHTDDMQMKIPVPQQPNPSPIFTGRHNVLDKLGGIFCHRTDELMSRRFCLLWGMGGIGKTQICLKFIEDMSGSFLHVFWVDASSEESIITSLKGISNMSAAKKSGVDGSVESVLKWISCIQEEWLIVFDNADDPPPDVVEKFIPPGKRGNILITSRNRSMGRIISFENSIEINEMEESDAITLLLKASNLDGLPEHLQAAREIVAELGCIPLGVDHAGAYIGAGNCDIKRYLRQFSLHRQSLMSDATFKGASKYDRTVYGTWDLSFNEIKRRADGQSTIGNAQAAQAAIQILQICAFYYHSNISLDIFQSAAEESIKNIGKLPQMVISLNHTLFPIGNDGHWDDFIFGKGIGVLLSFSLIKRGQSSDILSIHPLVHCWSREKMSRSDQQKTCQMGSILLSYAIPWGQATQDYALQQLIFPHIKANELYASQIGLTKEYHDDKYSKFSLVMIESGDWENGKQLQIQVMEERQKLLGTEHPKTLLSMQSLATTHSYMGEYNEAEKLQIKAVDKTKKLFGTEHPATLTSMENLASVYYHQGRWNDAEKLGLQTMNIRKELLGEKHLHTLISMMNLASTYLSQEKYNEAEQLGLQVTEVMKEVLGVEHPYTLHAMSNLAGTYQGQERWNDAEQLGIQVMDIRKKFLGADHPETLRSMANLAGTYQNQERWDEAEQLNIQVMDKRQKLLGTEHPDTLIVMENLANVYLNQGRLNNAEELEVQVMDKRKKFLGTEHSKTLQSMRTLAGIYQSQGRQNEAQKLKLEVINITLAALAGRNEQSGNYMPVYI